MKTNKILMICLLVLLTGTYAIADQYVKPYTFTSGTSAKASEVNANFDSLFNAVNELAQQGGGTGIPGGSILMWSGSTSNIPSGWALCNGSNGTPDLRNRFIVGAGSSYSVGLKGGVTSNNLAHSHTVNNHTHHIDTQLYSCIGDCSDGCDDGDKAVGCENHGHHLVADTWGASPGTDSQLSQVENRPPFYALCFIMKLN